MADSYDRYDNEGAGAGFMMGLLTGTVLGAGLGMLLAPKAGSELRGVLGEQARTIGSRASEQYRKASTSGGGWAEKGREFVDRARKAAEERGLGGSAAGGSAGYGMGSGPGMDTGSTTGSNMDTGSGTFGSSSSTGTTSTSYASPTSTTGTDNNRS